MTGTTDGPPAGPARSRRARLTTILLAAGLMIGLGIVATGTAVEVTSRPDFCGSCHIMKPYYESWKTSTHRNVACVECHIPPGFENEFRKKYEALSMVTSYFTGTYGTNPWTEIDDAACLVCHERRLLSGMEVYRGILFDHSAHLSGMPRGKKLRCTSCHSQIVQGSHIAVTSSTCILCHFKGQVSGEGTARCTLCHQVPRAATSGHEPAFDHSEVVRLGMECTGCHTRPEGSDGDVPPERCVTCHNDPDRLNKFDDTELVHRKHVTDHKVDCVNCHLEIKHVGAPRVHAAATACGTCHTSGHSPQMSLYSGVGGRGVEPMPSPMFEAGIRCEGCHIEIPGHQAATRAASDIACMTCHGPSYRRIFLRWREHLDHCVAALQSQMTETAGSIGRSGGQALADARFNLDLVSRGRSVHNVDYALALLKRAHEDMNAARQSRGLSALPLAWRQPPYETPCLQCHQGIADQTGTAFGRRFSHARHVIDQRLTCETCHLPHETKGRGDGRALLRFDRTGCVTCHHGEAASDCLSCHRSVRERMLRTALGEFSHAKHLDDAGLACHDCHELGAGGASRLKEDRCAECHG